MNDGVYEKTSLIKGKGEVKITKMQRSFYIHTSESEWLISKQEENLKCASPNKVCHVDFQFHHAQIDMKLLILPGLVRIQLK